MDSVIRKKFKNREKTNNKSARKLTLRALSFIYTYYFSSGNLICNNLCLCKNAYASLVSSSGMDTILIIHLNLLLHFKNTLIYRRKHSDSLPEKISS